MKRRMLLAAALLAAGVLGTDGAVSAQNTGVIEGRVVNGTEGGAPIGPIPILVQKWRGASQQEGVPDIDLQLVSEELFSTDEQGFFRVEGLEEDSTIRYVIQAGYEDIAYQSGPIRIENGRGTVEVLVFDVTEVDDQVTISRASMAIPTVDEANGLVGILEIYSFVNTGDRTYVGDLFSDPEHGGVTRFPLPANAVDISLGHGFGPDGFSTFDGGVVNRAPLVPGESEMLLAYAIPYTETTAALEKRYFYTVHNVTVLIPESIGRVTSPHLEEVGPVNIEGVSNILLTGSALRPGETFRLSVEGLPRFAIPGGGPSVDTALRGTAVGLMVTVVVAAAVLGLLLQRRRLVAAGEALIEMTSLERERGSLVGALARLDEEYQAGRVAEQDYERNRHARKRRLVDVMLLLREQPEGPGS